MQNIITSSVSGWVALLAGMVLLPILIHLINRLRHQRVRWAAMDFLLASEKKNRNRVWLRQLLLLLARIGCLLLVLLTIGQVGCNNDGMKRFLGGNVTHHYVLIDDSLSMGELNGNQTAMDNAKATVLRIADRIANKSNHRISLIRYTQALQGSAESGSDDALQVNDLPSSVLLNSIVVDRDIRQAVQQATSALQPASVAVSAEHALQLAGQLIDQKPAEDAFVYLVSDFRSEEWANANALQGDFADLAASGTVVEFVRCVAKQGTTNLAITGLRTDGSVRVAGIPLMMSVQVTNFGLQAAKKVQISLQSATYPNEATDVVNPANVECETRDLPVVLVDEIAAGESVIRQFPVFFETTGQHAVRASLKDDALRADNSRWTVTRLASSERVMLIENADGAAGRFLGLALAPNGMTGLAAERKNKSYLRDASDQELAEYSTLFLLDVDRLEAASIGRLKRYVENGGGVVFFTGPNTNLQHYTEQLFDSGKGVFPLPLQRNVSIPELIEKSAPDLVPIRHPVFASVVDVDFSPIDLVQIRMVSQPPPLWKSESQNSVRVIATVRGDERLPFIVEKQYGKGRVLACLTSAGSEWNNWLLNPTYPAILLMMQDYVSQGRRSSVQTIVGSNKLVQIPDTETLTGFQFVTPELNHEGWGRTVLPLEPVSAMESSNRVKYGQQPDQTSQPGVHEIWMKTGVGEWVLERFDVNVDSRESQLQIAERSDLNQVAPEAQITGWENFAASITSNRGTSLVRILLLLLLVFLVAEQCLAYSASWHPRRRSNRHHANLTGPHSRKSNAA